MNTGYKTGSKTEMGFHFWCERQVIQEENVLGVKVTLESLYPEQFKQ